MKVVTMAMNAAASAFSNCAPQKATSPDLLGNTRPQRKPQDYASGGEIRWGRPVPHLAPAALRGATLALLLLAGCETDAGGWAVLALGGSLLAVPLYFLLRGKLEDWRSFAEHAVRFDRLADDEDQAGCHGCADDYRARADGCAASIPRPIRARCLASARRAAGAVAP